MSSRRPEPAATRSARPRACGPHARHGRRQRHARLLLRRRRVVRAGRRHRPRARRARGRGRHRRRRRRVDPSRRRPPVGRGGAAAGRPRRDRAAGDGAVVSVDTMRAEVARAPSTRAPPSSTTSPAGSPTPRWSRGSRRPACPTSPCTGAGTARRCSRARSTTTSSTTSAASSGSGATRSWRRHRRGPPRPRPRARLRQERRSQLGPDGRAAGAARPRAPDPARGLAQDLPRTARPRRGRARRARRRAGRRDGCHLRHGRDGRPVVRPVHDVASTVRALSVVQPRSSTRPTIRRDEASTDDRPHRPAGRLRPRQPRRARLREARRADLPRRRQWCDLERAGRTDDLAATVNYAEVAADVVARITGPSFDLIERLAEVIADAARASIASDRQPAQDRADGTWRQRRTPPSRSPTIAWRRPCNGHRRRSDRRSSRSSDGFQCRRPARRDLQSIEAAPGDADHADRAGAPGLGREPGDDLERVVLLLQRYSSGSTPSDSPLPRISTRTPA